MQAKHEKGIWAGRLAVAGWALLAAIPSGAATSPQVAPGFSIQELAPGVHALVRTAPPGLLVDGNVLVIVNADDVVVVDSN